jgi:outer membrane cobalamin receptor
VQAEAGRYDTRSLSYGLAHKQGALETTLNLSHFRTEGYSAAAAGTEADGAEVNRVSATLRYQVNGTLALGGAVFHQQANSEYDDFGVRCREHQIGPRNRRAGLLPNCRLAIPNMCSTSRITASAAT